MDAQIKTMYEALSRNAIVRALFENYESLYVVNVETSAFKCYHESESYSSLSIEEEGEDFFGTLEKNVETAIYLEDREFVLRMMTRQNLMSALTGERFFSFVYRLMIDGKPLYHKLRATMDTVDGTPHFLIGVRNVDASFRQDKALAEKLTQMHSREKNHLEAILAGADGYLEADLTMNKVVEFQLHTEENLPDELLKPFRDEALSYDAFMNWHISNIPESDRQMVRRISDRSYLIECFRNNERFALVKFSLNIGEGRQKPCKIVFYLYRDASTLDIMAFSVLYDLTEQLRREEEFKELEEELQMIKLRNFTSQMQPHFLYNALGSIQEIILEDPRYAWELLGDFTAHLRSCIRAMTSDAPIPFCQELANIKAYVNIEKMRLGEKLKVVYDIGASGFSILPLSVQPIVENAIRHGIYNRGAKGGTVTVTTRDLGDRILITVEDDGVGFDVEDIRKKLESGRTDSAGLRNIRYRLEKMMQADMDISSCPGEGTEVTIMIPKKGENNESNNS